MKEIVLKLYEFDELSKDSQEVITGYGWTMPGITETKI